VDQDTVDACIAGGQAVNTALGALRDAEVHFARLAEDAPELGLMLQAEAAEGAIRRASRAVQQFARQVARTKRLLAEDAGQSAAALSVR
jgi:hypothetical protein